MKDFWKTVRLGIYVFALPLMATAAASAHQWLTEANVLATPKLAVSGPTVYAGMGIQRNHVIALDENGAVNGRVAMIDSQTKIASGVDGLKAFLVRDGEIVQQVYTDAGGYFQMNGIAEGAYSFIAAGEKGFVAYGVHVVRGGSHPPAIMEAAAVSPRFVAVREILDKYVPQQIAAEILALAGSDNHAPGQLRGGNRVQLTDGNLTGSVLPLFGPHRSVDGTHVSLIQGDVSVAEAEVDSNGEFTFENLQPGVYDFVAAGPSGFAALSFEAVAPLAEQGPLVVQASARISGQEPDAAPEPPTTDMPTSLDVSLTSPQDSGFVGEQVDYACGTCGEIYTDQGYEMGVVAEDCGYGCAAGGACGGYGDFSG